MSDVQQNELGWWDKQYQPNITPWEANAMIKNSQANIWDMINEFTSFVDSLPGWFKDIFKKAWPLTQKKLIDHVKVYDDHFVFKLAINNQETLVPISRKNLLINKEIPGSLETHNGMSYGKLSDNHFPEWQEVSLAMLQEMAKLMPAGDYNPAKSNSTAAYQLSILLDAPVAWYSTWDGVVYENDIKLDPIKDHITESDGSSYLYTWAKDDQWRYIKLWRHSDPDIEIGSIDYHDPSKLLPMRTMFWWVGIDDRPLKLYQIDSASPTNHGASVASVASAQVNNGIWVSDIPATDIKNISE